MQNEEKIKAAIEEVLKPLEYSGKQFQKQLLEKIMSAIAPHLGAVEPDWSDAPSWAEWRGKDARGILCYFQNKPQPGTSIWWSDGGKFTEAETLIGWQNTLERRPQ